MSRVSHVTPIVQHFTPRRVLGAVRQHPPLLFELPWMARAAVDWGVRAVTEEFHNNDDLEAFLTDPKTESADTIVFAIHGYFADKGHFAPVHQRVFEQEYGFGFFAPQYGTFRDIHLNARYLGTHVKNILRETDARIALYGHSLGALVALELFYDRLSVAEQDRISSVLLVAGPHHGTPEARHGYGFSADQMRVGSDYMRSWQKRYPTLPHGEKIVSFSAPSDAIVPKRSTHVPIPGAQHYVLDDLGASPLTSHVNLLYSRRVARALGKIVTRK
jgi:triacylglycerol esterase/lipase EstA (alpha/beta hydrolase family)